MPQRTFLALDLEEATLDHLAEVQAELCKGQSSARAVERENLHLTLIFLGDVADDVLAQVCELAAGAAALVKPFEYHVRGIECVPTSGPLRMVWAGVEDPTGRLAALAEGLRAALAGLGLHEETRSFHPHITLARVKSGRQGARDLRTSHKPYRTEAVRQAAEPYVQTDFGTQFAEEVVIYGSHLTPQGPIYAPTTRVPLGE
jgi:2'-5' RNA ligase